MKRVSISAAIAAALAALVAAVFAVTSAGAPRWEPALDISHVDAGCHLWSLSDGSVRVTATVRLAAGGSIVVTNRDMAPHTLIGVSGNSVRLTNIGVSAPLRHVKVVGAIRDEDAVVSAAYAAETGLIPIGGSVRATFDEPGQYELTTVESDSPYDWPRAAVDNQLVLRVQVAPAFHDPAR